MLALWVAGPSTSGPMRALVACKTGQTSTKTLPCVDAAVVLVDPIAVAQVASPRVQVDPSDGRWVLRFLDIPRGLYRIAVTSKTSPRSIKTFVWTPPQNMSLTAITSTDGGACKLAAGNISCHGVNGLAASTNCACALVVNFTATGLAPTFNGESWVWNGATSGVLICGPMTPCPYHLPPGVAIQTGFSDGSFVAPIDAQRGLYRLSVGNTTTSCCITRFNWQPMSQVTIRTIAAVNGGRCSVVGGDISCVVAGTGLVPSKGCHIVCELTVNFTATGVPPLAYGMTYVGDPTVRFLSGFLHITSMTP
jgi:hypothetical protein